MEPRSPVCALCRLGGEALIPKILPHEHNDMTALRRVPEEMDVVADGLWGVAVVTHAVNMARGLDVESGGIDG